jgi:hypothetical protein
MIAECSARPAAANSPQVVHNQLKEISHDAIGALPPVRFVICPDSSH